MTGRELVLYIVSNKLEDEPVFKDDTFVGFIPVSEAAKRLNVDIPTISALITLGQLDCIVVGGLVFIPADFKAPTIINKKED